MFINVAMQDKLHQDSENESDWEKIYSKNKVPYQVYFNFTCIKLFRGIYEHMHF